MLQQFEVCSFLTGKAICAVICASLVLLQGLTAPSHQTYTVLGVVLRTKLCPLEPLEVT